MDNTQRYIRPLVRIKFGNRSFSSNGPRIWNTLPVNLQDITDIAKVKSSVKSHFF